MAAPFRLVDAVRLPGPLSSARPVLYTHLCCPYAQRVLLTLLLKDPPGGCDVVHMDLSHKPRWFARSVNPSGLVPAVVHEGVTLLESLDICQRLDELMPQQPLTPAGGASARHMQTLLSQSSSIVSAGLDLVAGSTARHWGIGSRPSQAQQRRFEAACQRLDDALQDCGGPFLVGAAPSLADVALGPFFQRFRLCDCGMAGSLVGWLDALGHLPAWRLSSPDEALFSQAVREHAALDWFDYATTTPTQLHPHLEAWLREA